MEKACEDTYGSIINHLYDAAKIVFDAMCLRVVQQERKENEKRDKPCSNFTVSGDGSWKKRGFTSLYSVTTLIAYYSGKVIDFVVKNSVCKACDRKNKNDENYIEWFEQHQEECSLNHVGSADKMEVDAIKEMFSASEEKFGVRYLNYIGDGDSKTYKAILDLNPYGDDFLVTKSECVNHVKKRMGTRLRNVKKNQKLGGKGKLTDSLIKKLTKYYGLAIMRNTDSVEGMKKSIMAIYLHSISTNENPRHENCPEAKDSWCKYRRAQSLNQEYEQPAPLHKDVAKAILPIFEDLSKEDLLQRCLGGHTQNANESFNAMVAART